MKLLGLATFRRAACSEAPARPPLLACARGYFCCSSGNVTDEVIAQHIENQQQEEDAEFSVGGRWSSEAPAFTRGSVRFSSTRGPERCPWPGRTALRELLLAVEVPVSLGSPPAFTPPRPRMC